MDGQEAGALARWREQLEGWVIPEEILGLPAGSAIAAEQLELDEIHDVVLSMEYETTPT